MSFSYRQVSENQIKDIFQNNDKLILVTYDINQFSHIFYLLFHAQWQHMKEIPHMKWVPMFSMS